MTDIVDKPRENQAFKYYIGPEGEVQVKLPIYKNCLPETDPPISFKEREELLKSMFDANPNYAEFKILPKSEDLLKTLGIKEIKRETNGLEFSIDGIILSSDASNPKSNDIDIYSGYMQHNVLWNVVLNNLTNGVVGDYPEFSVYRYQLPDGKYFTIAELREYPHKYTQEVKEAVLRKTKASFYMTGLRGITVNPFSS